MPTSYDPRHTRISALKNAPGKEEALVSHYLELLSEIMNSSQLSNDKKAELLFYANQRCVKFASPRDSLQVHFDPNMREPQKTLKEPLTVIEKAILQFGEELQSRADHVPALSLNEIYAQLKETGIEITDTEIGGMPIKNFEKQIKQIIENDEMRRANEKGLGFDDSELVAEALKTEIKNATTLIPHPPKGPRPTVPTHAEDKNAHENEEELIKQYKEELNAIIKSTSLSDEKKYDLVLLNNQKMGELRSKPSQKLPQIKQTTVLSSQASNVLQQEKLPSINPTIKAKKAIQESRNPDENTLPQIKPS